MKKFYSQYLQDKFINEVLFPNMEKGYFIDIGAHDGISLSNTYFFESQKLWNGICFEPNPVIFESLKKNRTCEVKNACVGDANKEVVFCKVDGPSNMLSGIFEHYNDLHLKRIQAEIANYGGSYELIKVDMLRLSDQLEAGQEVHYLSIDTEGNELSILRSIDFKKNKFISITVENNYRDPSIHNFLKSRGFTLLTRIKMDEVYIHRSYYSLWIFLRTILWIGRRKWRNAVKKLGTQFHD